MFNSASFYLYSAPFMVGKNDLDGLGLLTLLYCNQRYDVVFTLAG